MGGRIGYADNPGGGSVFWVELPAISIVPAVARMAATSPRIARPGLRVLVVDDDALNRSIATGFLKHGGHKVVCLDNGAAAVAAASAEDFDVILMDVRMPGMNGLEATRRIRALPGPRGVVPVIALTAQAFAEQIEICQQAGMNTHVSKPFRQEVLLTAVELMAPQPAVAPARAEPDLAMFDRATFTATAAFLSPGEVQGHLRTLIARAARQCCMCCVRRGCLSTPPSWPKPRMRLPAARALSVSWHSPAPASCLSSRRTRAGRMR